MLEFRKAIGNDSWSMARSLQLFHWRSTVSPYQESPVRKSCGIRRGREAKTQLFECSIIMNHESSTATFNMTLKRKVQSCNAISVVSVPFWRQHCVKSPCCRKNGSEVKPIPGNQLAELRQFTNPQSSGAVRFPFTVAVTSWCIVSRQAAYPVNQVRS